VFSLKFKKKDIFFKKKILVSKKGKFFLVKSINKITSFKDFILFKHGNRKSNFYIFCIFNFNLLYL